MPKIRTEPPFNADQQSVVSSDVSQGFHAGSGVLITTSASCAEQICLNIALAHVVAALPSVGQLLFVCMPTFLEKNHLAICSQSGHFVGPDSELILYSYIYVYLYVYVYMKECFMYLRQ